MSTTVTRSGSMQTTVAPGAFPADDASDQDGVVVEAPAPLSLSAAVRARRDEFTRKKTIKVKVGSWNVAAIGGTEKDLGRWFVKERGVNALPQVSSPVQPQEGTAEPADTREEGLGHEQAAIDGGNAAAASLRDSDIDLYVLGLQEVVDISSVTEAMKTYTDPNPAQKWKTELEQALPEGYKRVAEQQLLGLLILIFASPDLVPSISNVSCTSVGTGLMGYLGNKGAVSVRLLLSDTTRACFVNCHLAAGSDKAAMERRVWDAAQVVARTRFFPVSIDGDEDGAEERIGDEDVAFWFGDLNYRLDDIPGEDVRRLLLLHTRNEYDVLNNSRRRVDTSQGYVDADASTDDGTPSTPQDHRAEEVASRGEREADAWQDPKSDPASLITTIESLLAHDQLRSQQRQRKSLHDGWREGEIGFLPTYKYDVGSVGMFDSGEKRRGPSWCDRILFRTKQDRLKYEEQAKQEAEVRRRDEEMKRKGLDQAAEEQNVLFDYDPDEDGLAYGEDAVSAEGDRRDRDDGEVVQTQDYHHQDELEIDGYTSHQHVLSSDHKPVDAVFTLTYDAVVPELKAKIQQEVVRDLDKAENENRPSITLVIDHHHDGQKSCGEADLDGVHFGSIAYDVGVHRSVTIANTGQIEATARFVGKEDEGPIGPQWLDVSLAGRSEARLEPGDSKIIDLTARVSDGDLVRRLNSFAVQLDDVLILRVDRGRDHFLPVKANWLPTCFCRSLDELVVAPESGVRSISRSLGKHDGQDGAPGIKSGPTRHSAPRELFAFTESIPPLAERSIADWDMLHPRQPPPWSQNEGENVWPFDASTWTFHGGEERDMYLAKVRECLDTSQPLDRAVGPDEPDVVQLEVLCETLVSFLGSLHDGIITASMWSAIESSLIQLNRDRDNGKWASVGADEVQALAMEALSSAPAHSVSMTFLTFMLANLIKQLAPALQEEEERQQLKSLASASTTAAPRRSRASSVRSETESEGASSVSPTLGVDLPGSKKGLFANLAIRRKRADTASSQSDTTADGGGRGSIGGDKRQQLIRSYAAVFAPLIIRASTDETAKGKEKKALWARKQRVMEAFLEVAQL
ncbi:hypothetical protein DV737_g5535, partial [Chaetothyriales sp. CBS 132003]